MRFLPLSFISMLTCDSHGVAHCSSGVSSISDTFMSKAGFTWVHLILKLGEWVSLALSISITRFDYDDVSVNSWLVLPHDISISFILGVACVREVLLPFSIMALFSISRKPMISCICLILLAICDFSSSSSLFILCSCFFSRHSSSSMRSKMPMSSEVSGRESTLSAWPTSNEPWLLARMLDWEPRLFPNFMDQVESYWSKRLKSFDNFMIWVALSKLCWRFLLLAVCHMIAVRLAFLFTHSVPNSFSLTLTIWVGSLWASLIISILLSLEHLDSQMTESSFSNGFLFEFHLCVAIYDFFSFLPDLRFITWDNR